MTKIKVWPSRKGLIVYDEAGRLIPEEGRDVRKCAFIVRRIQDGDLVMTDPSKRKAKKKSEGDAS
jgi:hypothetical protein